MNALIVVAHPKPGSFTHALAEAAAQSLRDSGWNVTETDLYAERFDPLLTEADMSGPPDAVLASHQANLANADLILLAFPLWWSQMPAILKGYVDRVFAQGIAYRDQPEGSRPLLTGKAGGLIITLGASKTDYESNGRLEALTRTLDEGILGFCGVEMQIHFLFDRMHRRTAEERTQMLLDVQTSVTHFAQEWTA